MPRAGGRWSVFEITARGDALTVVMNGQKTLDGVRDARFAAGSVALQHCGGLRNAASVVNGRGVIRFRGLELTPL